jgi:hypothetical protein
MALADYYARTALAASQILSGFDEERIRETLETTRVGVAIGADAAECSEGEAIIDLLIRLLARLYPTLVIRGDFRAQSAVENAMNLARAINPNIDFGSSHPTVEIAIGRVLLPSDGWRQIFIGSNEWNALVGTKEPQTLGSSQNPFGAGAAACLGAANVFRFVFQGGGASLDEDLVFSVIEEEAHHHEQPKLTGSIGDIVLVGAGAIGNATGWAFSRLPMPGLLHIVDDQTIDLGNLQRYVLADRGDEGKVKVDLLAKYLIGAIRPKPVRLSLDSFFSANGYAWRQMLLALDSARDRRAAQASLPEWIANAWTQPGDLGVSTHNFLDGACVACLYLADHALENEDAIVASALGVPGQLVQIRTLLHSGSGVPRDLLDSISAARSIQIERLLPFEGRPIRTLYTEGFCGGVLIPLGEAGTPRQEVHVPLAHQSALAGVLLAAAAVRHALGLSRDGTRVTRVDVMRPLGAYTTQPAAKDRRGICICQDDDYRDVYKQKFHPSG